MVRQTSLEALRKYRAAGKGQTHRAIILDFLINNPGKTRGEISALTGVSLQSVCGRVNELLGYGVVVEVGRRKCTVTGSSAMMVGPIYGDDQGRLF